MWPKNIAFLGGKLGESLLMPTFTKQDIEEGDLNKPEMTAKIVNVLESAMFQAMQKKQFSAVAANAKVLMRLVGLDTQEVNHQHRFKHGRSSAYY